MLNHKRRGRPGGFTLVELMITVAIATILLTIGVPSFTDLIQNNRVATQTNELVAALNLGRSEAVKRGRQVQVTITIPEGEEGWTANVSVGGETLRLVDYSASGMILNAATVTFAPTGVATAEQIFTMQPGYCPEGKDRRREINVAASGYISTAKTGCE